MAPTCDFKQIRFHRNCSNNSCDWLQEDQQLWVNTEQLTLLPGENQM
jgi:hypothetical protein